MRSLVVCTQPQCLLRVPETNARFLAQLVARLMAGEDVDVSREIPAEQIICMRDECVDCVERVMRGEAPLPTTEEARKLDDGLRSQRRARRAKRKETRATGIKPSKAGF